MRPLSVTRPLCVVAALSLMTAVYGQVTFTRFPANHATRVNPDTHLVLSFSSPPILGKSGLIRIYDAADHHLVDSSTSVSLRVPTPRTASPHRP